MNGENRKDRLPRFDRNFLGSIERFTQIGSGSLGGKAEGLVRIRELLAARLDPSLTGGIEVAIPRMAVIGTDFFDVFMRENGLYELALSGAPDHRIAHGFQRASLPAELVGDLRALIHQVHEPLAVRSSSLLEDALYEPFAGVYATKMIPNNQPEPDTRFRKLVEAVKFVYASAFFRGACDYIRATGRAPREEKMAVIVQEIVGRRHGDRFYPDISGVARSYNFYATGHARPEDGVVSLALGLGRTIVGGDPCWTYSPAWPEAAPPYNDVRDLLRQTQVGFWAVNMGTPPAWDPIAETEYLLRAGLEEAEEDGTLRPLASTYDPSSDRLSPGLRPGGARALTFAPILVHEEWPLNSLVRGLLAICQNALAEKVEIEFAATLPPRGGGPARLGFLQVRPMAVSSETVEIAASELEGDRALVASARVMGNGLDSSIRDVVYVKPGEFDAMRTRAVAADIEALNRALLEEGRPYLLIGFGRWGSQDPSLGIPVEWGGISGARAVVEATLPQMNVELSQGSHFFHNISSFRVCYFSVPHEGGRGIDWAWLAARPALSDTEWVRHVRLDEPLLVKVDGRSGKGVILKPA